MWRPRVSARMGVTERLARASAAHPWRTLAAWGLAVLAALALVATSLHGLTHARQTSSAHPSRRRRPTRSPRPSRRRRRRRRATSWSSSRAATGSATRSSPPSCGGFSATCAPRARWRRRAASRSPRPARRAPAARDPERLGGEAGRAGGRDGRTGTASPRRSPATAARTRTSASCRRATSSTVSSPSACLPRCIVLVLVFGAVVAGLVPVLLAILSILVGLGLVALLSLEFTLSVFIVNMLTGMGLALGIDYSLFVVSRYREERVLGLAKEDAIARAGATASRAVLFSGSTFVIALFGMLIVPTTIMRSLALGAIVVGIVSVAAALTLLPALLELLGDRVNGAPRARARPQPRACRRDRGTLLAAASSSASCGGRRSRSRWPSSRCSPSRCRSSGCTSARTASARCRTASRRSRATSRSSAPSPGRARSPCVIVAVGGGAAGTRCPRAARAPARRRPAFRAGHGPDVDARRRRAAHRPRARRRGRRPRGRGGARPPHAHRPRASSAAAARPSTSAAYDLRERRLLRRGDEPDAVRARVRARAELHPAHRRVPVARRRARVDRAQPALRRSGLRAAHARLPARRTVPGCSASSTCT